MPSSRFTNQFRSSFSVIKECPMDIMYDLGEFDNLTVKEYKKMKKTNVSKKYNFSVYSSVTEPTVDIVYHEAKYDKTDVIEKEITGVARDSDILRFIATE